MGRAYPPARHHVKATRAGTSSSAAALGVVLAVQALFDRGGDPPGGYPGQSELVRLGLSSEDDEMTKAVANLDV